ncbi:MAG TPA: 5-(carboxyamino)imidazole ribonucleotide mutase [Bacteroidales bacterium]|nr:5-(carboxyamino)imidazole ribonucleotide mutase [Bacteroidales bacterium]HCI55630.1 5-(carboxyamino)imidazole ribonucleotide mutase [Bacteroidales bacterium]HOU96384.1 5-(carboxyamino)imidazole ribonucleotide mutase [Bacteroidales bacterium]HQJ20443.1 5-(carboxyamino)imidazole ribonucleotide mutase [Bacteroidales bacterium]HRC89469.1 5-(carboxyamino)imidazole ribonucleotide mutase [Bacteroidales bacterium]
MEPLVSIIMGSISDMPVMEGAAKILNDFGIPFEIHALSAHRTPLEIEKFALGAESRGIKVIIAAAGMAAHLPGVIASLTPIPVIGVPIKASLEGLDSLLSIVQMPSGVPVATVGINAAQNAGILAAQIIASGNPEVAKEISKFKQELKKKVVQANDQLKTVKFPYKTN